MLARARGRVHPRYPLAVDAEHADLAQRRPRVLRLAVDRRDPAARDPYHARGRCRHQPAGRHLLSAAHRLLGEEGLGAERRRLSDPGRPLIGGVRSMPAVQASATKPEPRPQEVADLLVGAIDLHCHSGPAAMPRILDHHEALMDCAAAKFAALVYKDHFYLGVSHAMILEKLFPESGVKLFSGIALNNASGGINPHAVNHAINIGAKIVWMPTLSAANHLEKLATEGKTFPKTSKRMLDALPLSALDANG